jgi:hypothetical protein
MGSLLSDEKFFTSEIFRDADGARGPAPDLGAWREAARPAKPTSRNPTSTTA